MDTKYAKAYKEVFEVLNNVPKEDFDKIPDELIQMFKQKMDCEYVWNLDNTKPFEEQEMLLETKAILANIYRDYWVSPEQKARILAAQANELLKIEKLKKQSSNLDTVVNCYKVIEDKQNIVEETSLTVCENEGIFNKFINFFKGIFYKKERT